MSFQFTMATLLNLFLQTMCSPPLIFPFLSRAIAGAKSMQSLRFWHSWSNVNQHVAAISPSPPVLPLLVCAAIFSRYFYLTRYRIHCLSLHPFNEQPCRIWFSKTMPPLPINFCCLFCLLIPLWSSFVLYLFSLSISTFLSLLGYLFLGLFNFFLSMPNIKCPCHLAFSLICISCDFLWNIYFQLSLFLAVFSLQLI